MYDINDIITDLGLTGVCIFFNDDGDNSCGYDIETGFTYLNVHDLSVDVVAHELRHFWQWKNKHLIADVTLMGPFLKWKSERAIHMAIYRSLDYADLPWEVDAIEYENIWRERHSIPLREAV